MIFFCYINFQLHSISYNINIVLTPASTNSIVDIMEAHVFRPDGKLKTGAELELSIAKGGVYRARQRMVSSNFEYALERVY